MVNTHITEDVGGLGNLELIWGVSAIAALIGRTERQTHHMLASGEIAPARKVGNRWVVSRRSLERFFGGRA